MTADLDLIAARRPANLLIDHGRLAALRLAKVGWMRRRGALGGSWQERRDAYGADLCFNEEGASDIFQKTLGDLVAWFRRETLCPDCHPIHTRAGCLEMTTFYVTKYALMFGIQVVEADPTEGGSLRVDANFYPSEGKDFHRTFEAAIHHVERMRNEEIASLQKQIAKLEKLRFEVPACPSPPSSKYHSSEIPFFA